MQSHTIEEIHIGLPFFGGESIFIAEFVYLQCVMMNDCETIFCAKPLKLYFCPLRVVLYVV